MDNYGNNIYLSQDGYPSIDFTLLDRPSSSMVSVRESVASFPQGDSSFPSFNLFDGAGAVSYNDQLIADHGSYVETHKNVMRRHPSGAFVSFPNQTEGVHDFFEQGNRLKSDSGTGPRNEQSTYFLPRAAKVDERVQRPLYLKNSYEAASQCDNTERPNIEARMPHASVGFLQPMAEEAMDRSRSMNASFPVQNGSRNQTFSSQQGVFNPSLSVQKESRNEAFSPQGLHNLPSSNNFGPSNPASFKSGVPSHHPITGSISYAGTQYQNRVDNYDVSSHTGVVSNNAPSYDFLGNQLPWKGATQTQHSQVVASKQPQGYTKTAGPPELQSRQQQLQEMFIVHHLKQLEDTRQEQIAQQAPNHFSGTSYSDLLHGPDTPPSQQQTTEDYENHPSILPSQNAEVVGWSVDGPLYYQGVLNNLHMEQHQNLPSQMSFFGEAVDSTSHLGNLKGQNGLPLASYTVGHVPEQVDGKWKSPSSQQLGKPVLHSGSQHLTETRTTDFGLVNDWNSELRKTNQPLAKPGATHNPSGESMPRQKGGGFSQVNAFSQSQQHFQELQFAEQKNLLPEPKQPVSSPNLNLLPHQSLNHAKSMSKNGMQQRLNGFTIMDNSIGYVSQNLPSTPSHVPAASGQPQWLTSSSPSRLNSGEVGGRPSTPLDVVTASVQPQWLTSSSPSRQTFLEVGGRHQANSWEGFQAPQPSRGTGFNLEPASNTRYSALGNSNPQQLSQQGSPMLGALPGPSEASVARQQGLFNTQNVKTSVAGSGYVSNQQISMSLQDYRMEAGGGNVSISRVQPLSEPATQFQGAWKKYTPPNQFLPGGGSLGQQSLDGLGPRHGFQHQGHEASFHTPPMSNSLNNTSVQYVSNQPVREEELLQRNSQLMEKRVYHDHPASLPTANLMKTVSRHAMKVVPDVMEENQVGFYKSVESQEIFVERQQEVPQQQVNSCTENVSLAHLRGNQSSNSQSPQHVRLGLGPSHDLQHPTDAGWTGFPNHENLIGEVPPLKSAHNSLSAESLPRTAVSETSRKDEREVNQGSSAFTQRMVLHSSGKPASVFINRPPQVSRETASSDTSPTSSFASGHVMGGTSYVSANMISYSNEYNTVRDPPQIRDKVRGDSSSGVSQAQTSALNCASHQDVLNGYIGKTSCISNYSRLPNHSAGAPPAQRKHVVDSSTHADNDGGGMNLMQDRILNNISQRQVGNRLNAVDLKGLVTASKASVLDHSKLIIDNEKQYTGILESSRMVSSSARGVEKRDTMQRDSMMSRNTNNWRGEEHSVQVSSMQHAYNDQLNAYRATQSCNEASGLMPSPIIQGERHHSLIPVNDGLPDSLQAGKSQDSGKYQHANSFDSPALGSKDVGRNSRKPPLRAPSSSVVGPGMQPPSHEDLQKRHNSIGLESSTRAQRSPECAILPLLETNKPLLKFGKSSTEPMCAVSWSANQYAGNLQVQTEDSVSRLDALQQHSISVSEIKSHNISQPAKSHNASQLASTFEHPQSLKSLGKSHQISPYPTNVDHHSLLSAGFKHTNLPASGKPTFLPQQSTGNKENQVLSSDNQLPLVLDSSTMTQEGVSTPIRGPASTPKDEGQLSSLKVITPGEVAPPPSKRRKKQLPLLIPWHTAATQRSINLPSNSDAEMVWATALNRVPEKDFNPTLEDNTSSIVRAKRRLRLTTESMQRLFPPLPDGLMGGTTPAERECGIYNLAKLALEDACSLVTKTDNQTGLAQACLSTTNLSSRGQVCGMAKNTMLTKCVESFMERVKQLGMELARLDCSTSVSELQGETHELEKLSIVNRLARHHGIGFTMDSSDNLFIENIYDPRLAARKAPPQKYVTAAPLPRTLPEGVRCLPL